MTKLTEHRSHQLLTRILDQPDLVASVQALPAETLLSVVRRVGLEDAGELLNLVTSEQLVELFDGDLWEAPPGDEEHGAEQLSPERFALWLEVLGESGEAFVADRLAALPESLLLQALADQILVLDLDALAVSMSEGPADDLLDKALSAPLSRELDHYLILSRQPEGWDALMSAVLALDERHSHLLQRVLERLCAAAMEQVDDSGLMSVLTEAEALAEDAVADREERRTARGFVSLSDARAFDARSDEASALIEEPERDPIAKAHFRRLDRTPRPAPSPSALRAVLADAGIEAKALPQLGTGSAEVEAFADAMRELERTHPELHADRLDELAFVTNVVVTLAEARGAPVRPATAALEVASLCARGLSRVADRGGLARYPLDLLYRIGRSPTRSHQNRWST